MLTALIRVIECTNGCVLYTEMMKGHYQLSMLQAPPHLIIKSKVLIDGTEIVLPKECHGIMNEARDLYVRGFKQGDEEL